MIRRIAAVALLLAGVGPYADAQQLWLSAIDGQSSHPLVRNPRGPSAGVTWPFHHRYAIRAAYYFLDHRETRVGSTCVGLVLDPAECPAERVGDRSTLNEVVVGMVATMVRRGGFFVGVIPSASFVSVQAKSRGEQTGRTLEASELMLGFGVGVELTLVPQARWPIAFHVGAHTGMLAGRSEAIVDGYSPFTDGMRLTRLEVGISLWKPSPGAQLTGRS
ncbi:MAG: hypothetical protein ABR499_03335 [Gemmatimonadaceae bacterium]